MAGILRYPDRGYHDRVSSCRRALEGHYRTAADCLHSFAKEIEGKPLEQLEELYIQTFDFNPRSTLDVGWHLFGEDFNRGAFLIKIRREMARLGVPESAELPDHLAHILAVLGRMEPEAARNFAVSCVIPAVSKTLDGIPEGNPYHQVIEGIVALLDGMFGQIPEESKDR